MKNPELPSPEIWEKMDKFDRYWTICSLADCLPESERRKVQEATNDHEMCGNWDVGQHLRSLNYRDEKDILFAAFNTYLLSRGWQMISPDPQRTSEGESNWFQYLDPLTGQSHRADFAVVIETEREISRKLNA